MGAPASCSCENVSIDFPLKDMLLDKSVKVLTETEKFKTAGDCRLVKS